MCRRDIISGSILLLVLGLWGIALAWRTSASRSLVLNLVAQGPTHVEDGFEQHPYRAARNGNLTDLSAPAGEILLGLPEVVEVSHQIQVDKPTHRIIQFHDWRFHESDALLKGLGKWIWLPIPDDRLERRYLANIAETELGQAEQRTILNCLVRHHGLRTVAVAESAPADPAPESGTDSNGSEQERNLDPKTKSLQVVLSGLEFDADPEDLELANGCQDHGSVSLRRYEDYRIKRVKRGPIAAFVKHHVLRPIPIKPTASGWLTKLLDSAPVTVLYLPRDEDLSAEIQRYGKGTCDYIRVRTKHEVEFKKHR